VLHIYIYIYDISSLRVKSIPRPLYHREKETLSIVQKVGWAPGPAWTGVENLSSTGILSSEHPGCSESLYCLRC